MNRNRNSGARNSISFKWGYIDGRNVTADTDNTRCPNRDCKKRNWHRNNKREKALSMRTIAKTREIDHTR